MIVVAIVAFLAAVALPQYSRYLAKARQTEVMVNLASLHTALQAYYAEHGHYTNVLIGENGIGWKPDGYHGGGEQENFYYTYGFNFAGAQEGVHYFTGKLKTSKEELGNTYADGEQFLVKAAGNLTSKKADIWQIDQARKIAHTQDGVD
ncbi:MAG: hypothetical protein H6679_01385 [Epsilonproteobacteria bacterium]|nr:hypothetical protein [Campylobacterota bacterium]